MLPHIPTKIYILLLLQQLIHKLLGIEYPIINVVYLDQNYLTLSLPLRGGFCLDSFGSVYVHLMLYYHIATGMVNKKVLS